MARSIFAPQYGRGLSRTYSRSSELHIGEGLRIPVLDLETLIAIKEQIGGEKEWLCCRYSAKRSMNPESEAVSGHRARFRSAKSRRSMSRFEPCSVLCSRMSFTPLIE